VGVAGFGCVYGYDDLKYMKFSVIYINSVISFG
jgi:hypothetical protein